MHIRQLNTDEIAAATDVLVDAFTGYPYFDYVLGDSGNNYQHHLNLLNTFYSRARFARDEYVLGLFDEARLAGVALVGIADGRTTPENLDPVRDAIWAEIGGQAKDRDKEFEAVCSRFELPQPRMLLDMLAVRRADHGRGFGRALLEATHKLSSEWPGSVGVSLTTETPTNVKLYQHFGYEVVGRGEVGSAFTSWTMFRPEQG